MDAEKLRALREAAEKATPGPWYRRGQFVSLRPTTTGMGGTLHTNHVATCVDFDIAAFIAQADPTTILALLASHDALEKELIAARKVVERARTMCSYSWEDRLDDSAVSDDAKSDSRELSYSVYEYDRIAGKAGRDGR